MSKTRSPSSELATGYQRVWRSSLIQAVAAETLAFEDPDLDEATCFVVGLLQDIGVLALLHGAPKEYIESVLGRHVPPLELERDAFGFTHVDVGIELAQRWHLEQGIVDAIAQHHEELSLDDSNTSEENEPTQSQRIAEIANAAARIEEWISYHSWNESSEPDQHLLLIMQRLGMESDSLVSLVDEIRLRVNEMSILFGIDVGDWPDENQLVRDAKALLDSIALGNALETLETEKRLAKAQQELQKKSATEFELQSAKDAAETASGLKSEYLANMSHEIRTPLTVILGYAEILMNETRLENAPPERFQAVEAIQKNGQHLLGIIDNVLDLSKIEAGKLDIELIRCSPFRLLSDVVALLRGRAETKNLTLEFRNTGPIPETILTDPTRLTQILINLVRNAIKFTDAGGVGLMVETTPDRNGLTFKVTDSGIGMSQEQISNLFSPFTQADASTTRQFGGTGLGLVICKRLTALLSGTISVTSEPNVGTMCTATIASGPLDGVRFLNHPQQEATDQDSALLLSENEFVGDDLNGCRVLLADNAKDVRLLVSVLLNKVGVEVAKAENGQEAYEMAIAAQYASMPFDVVLMDVQMPVLDGYAATRKLRAAGYSLPIVALTAHALSQTHQACIDAGCDDYLAKPFTARLLRETVARHWSERVSSLKAL